MGLTIFQDIQNRITFLSLLCKIDIFFLGTIVLLQNWLNHLLVPHSLLVNIIKFLNIKFLLFIILYNLFNINTLYLWSLVNLNPRTFSYFWYQIWRWFIAVHNICNKYYTFLCVLFCYLIAICKRQFQIFIQSLYFLWHISLDLIILRTEDFTFVWIS